MEEERRKIYMQNIIVKIRNENEYHKTDRNPLIDTLRLKTIIKICKQIFFSFINVVLKNLLYVREVLTHFI